MSKEEKKSSKDIRSEIAGTHESERTQHQLEREFNGVISPKEVREGEEEKAKLKEELREAEHRESVGPKEPAA